MVFHTIRQSCRIRTEMTTMLPRLSEYRWVLQASCSAWEWRYFSSGGTARMPGCRAHAGSQNGLQGLQKVTQQPAKIAVLMDSPWMIARAKEHLLPRKACSRVFFQEKNSGKSCHGRLNPSPFFKATHAHKTIFNLPHSLKHTTL